MKTIQYMIVFLSTSLVVNFFPLIGAVIQSQVIRDEPPVSTVQGNTVIQNYPLDELDESLQAPENKKASKVNDRKGKIPRNPLPQNKTPRKRVTQNKIPRNSLPQNKIPRKGLPRDKVPRNPLERNQIPHNPIPAIKIPDNKLPRERQQDDRTSTL